MSEENKDNKPKKARKNKYDEKLAVKGSFMDLVKASVKDADNKSAPKK
jgi:hypothetical protein